jgi:NAD(P)-dependent dehydrogenase (short-subunit alcohol dehydrogenase family)
VVTGAASGIGRAAALAMKAAGYRVTAIDRNDPGAVADRWFGIDLDDPKAVLPSVDTPIDALINAAGLPPRAGTEAKVLRVNFLALRHLTLSFLPMMAAGGSIVNMASKAGAHWRENISQVKELMAYPDGSRLDDFVHDNRIDAVRSYDLSKEAVIVWTKSMTADLIERGVRMNAVSPAAVDTPILDDFKSAFGDRAARGIRLTRRAGRADEIAAVIAFLASPRSEWLRGCNIEADGGLTAQLEIEKLLGSPD